MNILIVEDEPMIAWRIERLTRSILDRGTLSVRRVRDLAEAQETLSEGNIDLLFLDLNLSGEDGFEVLRRAASGSFHTVVISAYTDRAIEAFELGVLDFIGKPFGRERLAKALRRMRGSETSRPEHAARYLAIRRGGAVRLVGVEEVRYVQGAGSYSQLMLYDGTSELHEKSLRQLATLLPPDFERIHRSYIVRLSEVAALEAKEGSRYEAQMKDGLVLPVGRTRREQLKKRIT